MLKERLLGAWSLVSLQTRWSDGRVTYLFGEDAKGSVIYDASGYFSGQVMKQNRPNFASNDMHRGEPEEVKEAFNGYLAYWGRFEVNEEENAVIHLPEGSLFPNWIGGKQPRKIEFDGEQVILSAQPMIVNGMEGVSTVRWQRAR